MPFKRNLSIDPKRLLDLLEQVVMLVLYSFFVYRLLPRSFSEVDLYLLLMLLSEGAVVILLLIRKQTRNISTSFKDWFFAYSATSLPLLIYDGETLFLPEVGSTIIMIGMAIHFTAKIFLLRSFGIVAANRGIKTHGLYKIVRHPMYFGYLLTHIGFVLSTVPPLWDILIYLTTWSCMIMRIKAEERILVQSAEYQEYANNVRFRLIPWIY